MSIINVQLSIPETKSLLAYIEELEECARIGGSYNSIYTTIETRLQEAQTNEQNLRECTCGSSESWVTCNENTPHCG